MVTDDEVFLAIRGMAFRDALLNKGLSSVLQFYSEKFYTPLHVVESLPFEDVFYNVMVYKYRKRLENEEEDPEWIAQEIDILTSDPEKAKEKLKAANENAFVEKPMDDDMAKLMEEAAEENIQNEKEVLAEQAEKLAEKLKKAQEVDKLAKSMGLSGGRPLEGKDEELSINFVSDDEMERLANMTPEELLFTLKK